MNDDLHLFKALADATRLRIVRLLVERTLCVCELTDILGLEQSRMSHQLKVLLDAGLLENVRVGRWIIYRIPKARRGMISSLLRTAAREDPDREETHRQVLADLERCLKKNLRGLNSCPPGKRAERMPAVRGKSKSVPNISRGRSYEYPAKEIL